MEEFFSDPWVTGIGGGLISGIIVYFLTTFIAEKRQNKEYKQKVSAANRDVIYLIRTCIPEKITPNIVLVDMLIDSVSRKYSVRRNDMLTVKQIYSDISMEIMDSYFISAEKKIELCQMITDNMNSKGDFSDFDTDNINVACSDEMNNDKQRMAEAKIRSLFMATVSSALVTILTFLFKEEQLQSIWGGYFSETLFIVIIISFMVIVITLQIENHKKGKN